MQGLDEFTHFTPTALFADRSLKDNAADEVLAIAAARGLPLKWVARAAINALRSSAAAVVGDGTPVEAAANPVAEAYAILAATEGRRVSDIHINVDPLGAATVEFEIDGHLELYKSLSDIEGLSLIDAFWAYGTNNGGTYSANSLTAHPFPRYTLGSGLPPHLYMIRAQIFTTLRKALVIRLVPRPLSGRIETLGQLQYDAETIDAFGPVARRDTGGVLITGPIGHGKTTLLYALADADYRYRTDLGLKGAFYSREQPPERILPWIRQIPIGDDGDWEEAGQALLRGALKVGITGEIRALTELASFANQALIFKAYGTFHAADAISTFVRARELGLPDHLLKNPQIFSTVISQRLVPVLCPHCSVPWVEAEDAHEHHLSPLLRTLGMLETARRKGRSRTLNCEPICYNGVIGRRPVAEVLDVSEDLIDLILASPGRGRAAWLAAGGRSMGQAAYALVQAGQVDPEYVDRVLPLAQAAADIADAPAPAPSAQILSLGGRT